MPRDHRTATTVQSQDPKEAAERKGSSLRDPLLVSLEMTWH